ncbi:unnamed protein product [Rotaria sp. Silwood1]|nr:unnamed protein product [Rotaria sp. Silwood1]
MSTEHIHRLSTSSTSSISSMSIDDIHILSISPASSISTTMSIDDIQILSTSPVSSTTTSSNTNVSTFSSSSNTNVSSSSSSNSLSYSSERISFIEDVIFLHIWAINVFRQFRRFSAEYIDIIGFIFSLTEIFRRFIWNYFRLENEHLINCGEFRAVRDISIAPLSTAVDHATSENMIDKEMGIKNRKKMLDRIESTYIGIGLALRVFLFFQTRIKNDFEDNAEFVTPLNSWERIIEGIYLRKFNLSLFVGSIIHEVCKGI